MQATQMILILMGSGLAIYGCLGIFRFWPQDFFISEKARLKRSIKIGASGALMAFGIINLALGFVDEEVTFIKLLGAIIFFGVISIFVGLIGAASTYRRLEPFTKHKDDIGTVRDE